MIDDLLSRLDRVKQTGPGRWIASTPTRDDKRPSMTIRVLDDGRILLHDFGGDSVEDILDALALDWSALFPENTTDRTRPERRPFPALDVLRAVSYEATVVMCAAACIRNGDPLTRQDSDRLALAVGRLQEALALAGGGRHG